MCLSYPINEMSSTVSKNLNEGVGYKAVWATPTGKVVSQIRRVSFKLNRWLYDNSIMRLNFANIDDNDTYQSGFHICLTISGAEEFLKEKHKWIKPANAIYKVKFKNVVQLGTQYSRNFKYNHIPIAVTKEMIIKERIIYKPRLKGYAHNQPVSFLNFTLSPF